MKLDLLGPIKVLVAEPGARKMCIIVMVFLTPLFLVTGAGLLSSVVASVTLVYVSFTIAYYVIKNTY